MTDHDDARGAAIASRMDRLGISGRELADRIGYDRQTVRRAREGKAQPTTMGAIERWLDDFEHEAGYDLPASGPVVTIQLGPGVKVTFTGDMDADDLAEKVAKIVDKYRSGGAAL